jgi:N6-adenosine-specific RNA methylase IME4
VPAWPFDNLKPLRYGALLVDPPWRFANYSPKGEAKKPTAHYDCMTLEAIKAPPVSQLAAPDCALIRWATAAMLPEAIDTMKVWGFAFKSAGAGEKWALGSGYCYRSAAEFWLLGTIGNLKQMVRNVRNLIVALVREHSRKPEQMRSDIEALWPGPQQGVEVVVRTQPVVLELREIRARAAAVLCVQLPAGATDRG